MTPLPTLRQLQFLGALARRRSFSRAADDCLVSQSTLSAGIKELESSLQKPLVDRSTRAFALTPVGEEVLRRAEQMLAIGEDMLRVSRAAEPLSGAFRLGVIPTIGPFVLPKALPVLREGYPRAEFYLREDQTAPLVDRLRAGLEDAVLMAFPYEAEDVDWIDIGEDVFHLACAPDHPLAQKDTVTLDDIAGADLLLLEDGHCLRDHALSACRLQRPENVNAFGATSLFTLVQMVHAGLGATLLPEMAVRAGLAEGAGVAVRPFAAPAPSRRIGVAWRKESSREEEAQKVAEAVRAAL